MKAQIEVLLSVWGRWAIKRAAGALGYPSQSAGFEEWMPPAGDTYASRELSCYTDADITAIDESVRLLPTILQLTAIEVYQRGGSIRAVAGRMGISYTTLGKYLTALHEKIDVDMQNRCGQNPSQLDRVHNCAPAKPATAR